MNERLKPLLASRNASEEQGSCGIKKCLLVGGQSRQFAVSQVVIQNARPHFHDQTWELYIVQKGQGTLVMDGVPMKVSAGDIVEIPPKVVHQAIPEPEMTILVVMSPINAEKSDINYV